MKESVVKVASGWVMLPIVIVLWLCVPGVIVAGIAMNKPLLLLGLIVLIPAALLITLGFFTLQPNEARVLVLFGQYKGTVRDEGFSWANPFCLPRSAVGERNRYKVSLRVRNFQTESVKVNDQRGNPIEIGAVIVWRVADTAQALFDVDDYENYIAVQSESAIRHLASSFPYDHMENESEVCLRSGGDIVSQALNKELQERLEKAGVKVDETRITHLAYAPEIAQAMLRRQQAEAVIAARKKIVQGAVSMVEMALKELSEKKVVELDEERKAAMVGNLLVVLCGESETQPIVNAGTLYH